MSSLEDLFAVGGKRRTVKRRVAKRRTVKRVAKRRTVKRVAKRRTVKRVAKRRTVKRVAKQAGGKRQLPAAFKVPLKPDAVLADIIGSKARPRQEMLKALWDYFKKNKLNQGREIFADEKVKKLAGKSKFTMFEVMGIMNKHLKRS